MTGPLDPVVGREFRWDYHRLGEYGEVVAVSDEFVWFQYWGPIADNTGRRATYADAVARGYWDIFAEPYGRTGPPIVVPHGPTIELGPAAA